MLQFHLKAASALNCLHPPLLQHTINFDEQEEGYKLIACKQSSLQRG